MTDLLTDRQTYRQSDSQKSSAPKRNQLALKRSILCVNEFVGNVPGGQQVRFFLKQLFLSYSLVSFKKDYRLVKNVIREKKGV